MYAVGDVYAAQSGVKLLCINAASCLLQVVIDKERIPIVTGLVVSPIQK